MILKNISGETAILYEIGSGEVASGETFDTDALFEGQPLCLPAKVQGSSELSASLDVWRVVVDGVELSESDSLAALTPSSEEGLRFANVAVTAASLTDEGVFVLDPETASQRPHLILDPGIGLHGLAIFEGGIDVTASRGGWHVMVTCSAAAGALLVGESLGPNSPTTDTDPAHRFKPVGGTAGTVAVDQRLVQYLYNEADQRWHVSDWSALPAGGDPAHWAGGLPDTVGEALHRMAAKLFALDGQIG
jgi:hypothetical protein